MPRSVFVSPLDVVSMTTDALMNDKSAMMSRDSRFSAVAISTVTMSIMLMSSVISSVPSKPCALR